MFVTTAARAPLTITPEQVRRRIAIVAVILFWTGFEYYNGERGIWTVDDLNVLLAAQGLGVSRDILMDENHVELRVRTGGVQDMFGGAPIRVHLSGHFCQAPKPELLHMIEDCGAVEKRGGVGVAPGPEVLAPLARELGGLFQLIATAAPGHALGEREAAMKNFEMVRVSAKFCGPEADSSPETALAVTASGFSMAGVGSAFWGLVAGIGALMLEAALRRWRSR